MRVGQITSGLQGTMSSSYDAATTADKCLDGNYDTHCDTGWEDSTFPSPWLRISYDCRLGVTSLSVVVVINRGDCCKNRINAWALEFRDADNMPDMFTYNFTGGLGSYVVTVPQGEMVKVFDIALLDCPST